jgi:hypothetical protein
MRADGQGCRALLSGLIGDPTAKGATYNAAAAQQCLATEQSVIASAGDICKPNNNTSNNPSLSLHGSSSCGQVYTYPNANKQPGDPCTADSDCAPQPGGTVTCRTDFRSGPNGSNQVQYCQDLVVGKAGDSPCIATISGNITSYPSSGSGPPPPKGYSCDIKDSLYCDSTTHSCLALQEPGGKCSGDDTCVTTAYCANGTCAPRIALGQPCTATFSSGCIASAMCDASSHTCVPRLPDGSPCTGSQQCVNNACVNSKCSASGSFGGSLELTFLCGGRG